jgi:hypothetical protein
MKRSNPLGWPLPDRRHREHESPCRFPQHLVVTGVDQARQDPVNFTVDDMDDIVLVEVTHEPCTGRRRPKHCGLRRHPQRPIAGLPTSRDARRGSRWKSSRSDRPGLHARHAGLIIAASSGHCSSPGETARPSNAVSTHCSVSGGVYTVSPQSAGGVDAFPTCGIPPRGRAADLDPPGRLTTSSI